LLAACGIDAAPLLAGAVVDRLRPGAAAEGDWLPGIGSLPDEVIGR
jgi:hypothetical protein